MISWGGASRSQTSLNAAATVGSCSATRNSRSPYAFVIRSSGGRLPATPGSARSPPIAMSHALADDLAGRAKEAVRQPLLASLERERAAAPLHASEITRLEVLAGMRADASDATRALLSTLVWHPVDADVSEAAGALGRRWLASRRGVGVVGGGDLAIAATALGAEAAC